MIANDMRRYFKDLYDGASATEMGFDDSEVSRFLNMAQELEIERRFFENRNSFLEGYEVGSKRDAEFVELKRHCYIWDNGTNSIIQLEGTTETANQWEAGSLPNSTVIELPTDFMYFSGDMIDLTSLGVRYRNVNVKSINEDQMYSMYNNVFLKPNRFTVYRYSYPREDTGRTTIGDRSVRRCLIITDENTTINRYHLSYIRRPQDIVVDILTPTNQRHCELDESFHLGIVRRAVQLALGSIGSDKYQISYAEKSLNE